MRAIPSCRYGLRPPLAKGRLTKSPDGTVLYQMKRRFSRFPRGRPRPDGRKGRLSDGRHVLSFQPQQFLLRLCALVPPRRFHMDVLCCPRCGSRMELIATIEDPTIARTILVHLGLPIRAPPPSPPWRPQPSLPSPSSTIDGIDGIDPASAFD